MALEIIIGKSDYEMQSGGTIIVQADVRGWLRGKERNIIYNAEKGSIDKNGRYKAPDVAEDTEDQVTITSIEDPNVSKIVNILIKKKEKAKSRASSAEVKALGMAGEYILEIQTVNDAGQGVESRVIITDVNTNLSTILPEDLEDDKSSNPYQIDIWTDEDGYRAITLIDFNEPVTRKLRVRLVGTPFDREIPLEGPKKEIKVLKGQGFWANAIQ